jgi:hypothetical protein
LKRLKIVQGVFATLGSRDDVINLPPKLRGGVSVLRVFHGFPAHVTTPNIRVVTWDNLPLAPDRTPDFLGSVVERISVSHSRNSFAVRLKERAPIALAFDGLAAGAQLLSAENSPWHSLDFFGCAHKKKIHNMQYVTHHLVF